MIQVMRSWLAELSVLRAQYAMYLDLQFLSNLTPSCKSRSLRTAKELSAVSDCQSFWSTTLMILEIRLWGGRGVVCRVAQLHSNNPSWTPLVVGSPMFKQREILWNRLWVWFLVNPTARGPLLSVTRKPTVNQDLRYSYNHYNCPLEIIIEILWHFSHNRNCSRSSITVWHNSPTTQNCSELSDSHPLKHYLTLL